MTWKGDFKFSEFFILLHFHLNNTTQGQSMTIYEFNDLWNREILKFIGNVTPCRQVSKKFIDVNVITRVKFYPTTSRVFIYEMLKKRESLRTVDFSGSMEITDCMIRVIMDLVPDIEYLILDRCDNITIFPNYGREDNRTPLYVKMKRCVMTTLNSPVRFPICSLNGCWKLFPPMKGFKPEDVVELQMCALNSNTYEGLNRMSKFFYNDSCYRFFEMSILREPLQKNKKWTVLGTTVHKSRSIVLVRVDDYSLVLFFLVRKRINGHMCWTTAHIYTVDICKMWLFCSMICNDEPVLMWTYV